MDGRYRPPTRTWTGSGCPAMLTKSTGDTRPRASTVRTGWRWGNLSGNDIFDNVVAAGTLYTLAFMEEVSERLGVAWEPREAHGRGGHGHQVRSATAS